MGTSHVLAGRRGEAIAAWFLVSRGCRIIERNATVAGDELDLVMADGRDRVAVEVKYTTRAYDPLLSVDDAKWSRIVRAAASYAEPITRIDIVGIVERSDAVAIAWLRDVD